MARFIFWVLALAFAVGFGPRLFELTTRMAKAAVHAHQFDQMSYSKFTHSLLTAKPRALPKKSSAPQGSEK